ncbi:putative 8-amino-7-oxononanoate synthase/2-amino-3-ketobutyrate coenzyme A ligase [Janthinobacterium sp. HH01]|uniref:aminotransferase class I/II-fold pyridoxal phosphate-dependent enzyme n=1 Tax=Janthinobacterium sp. HH01 TaxID=1198452 RepID=UPI0002AE91DD|nr:pyridoxal phosphate-dependent aminotransferase family protein [Janthinobacterium sp. HH01]ELX10952.1 putative 8-amino-7-oxononanoate synthase/2-amino-3-ketobutyrate coenzyme A ligase [Janthinobacterium sp. HH01]
MHDLSDIADWLKHHPVQQDAREHGGHMVSFSSHDYLALAGHPRLVAAAKDGLDRYGVRHGDGVASWQPGAEPEVYRALESRLGALARKSDAVLFVSGYMTNIGVLSSIVKAAALARLHGYRARKRHKYAYYSDEFNHVSIREGIQMSGALRYTYRHGDMAHLESLLKSGAEEGCTPIVVSDGVFGMEGTIAPLPQLVALAERYGALLYIDDAHATGVLGADGGGSTEHYDCHSPCIMQMGSLGKALGALGGYVAVEREAAEVIRMTCAAYGYASPPPPERAAALLAALDLLEQEPQRRQRLWDNQRYFIEKMAPLGYTILSTLTPILPVLVGEAETCQRYAIALRKEGVHVDAVQFPAAPVGQARLRFVINAGHTREQIDHAVRVMAQLAGRASRLAA